MVHVGETEVIDAPDEEVEAGQAEEPSHSLLDQRIQEMQSESRPSQRGHAVGTRRTSGMPVNSQFAG